MADDVQVANRRLDASENEALIGMARMGADAFGYAADLWSDRGLDPMAVDVRPGR